MNRDPADAIRFLETVDSRDVLMTQCGEQFGLALEPRAAIGIVSDRFVDDLRAVSRCT